jgi:hypothetical protein
MTTDRDRLTTFFYLLLHPHDDYTGVGWATMEAMISDASRGLGPGGYSSPSLAAMAREMVMLLLGPDAAEAEPALDPGWPAADHVAQLREVIRLAINEHGGVSARIADAVIASGWTRVQSNAMGYLDAEAIIAYDLERPVPAFADVHDCIRAIADKPHKAPQLIGDLLDQARSESETRAPSRVDRERRETLLAAAEMLTCVRDRFLVGGSFLVEVDEMIDRCNLAAIADGGVVRSEPDPLTLETATGDHLDFAGEIACVWRASGESDSDYRENLQARLTRQRELIGTGATAAEVERLRRFEDGVTELLGEPRTGTAEMLIRLRHRLAAGTVVQHYHFSTGGGCDVTVNATADSVLVNGQSPRLSSEAKP